VKQRCGVTEIELSDGRKMHALLHLDRVSIRADGNIEVCCQVVPELILTTEYVHPTHETVQ
jgi:hypothetical protein